MSSFRTLSDFQKFVGQGMQFRCIDMINASFSQTLIQYHERLDERIITPHGIIKTHMMHKFPAGLVYVLPAHFTIFDKLPGISLLFLFCHSAIF